MPSLPWTTGGNASWFPQTTVSGDGFAAAQTGRITHNQATWVETTLTGPSLLVFSWKVSSEEDCDFLQFHMDGLLKAAISGDADWTTVHTAVPPGIHKLRWTYTKDEDDWNPTGLDAGWLDMVTQAPLPVMAADGKNLLGANQIRVTRIYRPCTLTIEASPDLKTWTAISTNTSTNITLKFTDNASTSFSRRFYRAVQRW